MRAAVFDAEHKVISIADLSIPRPGPEELLVRVHRCGVCGSDVSMTGDVPYGFRSGRFGHEYAGEVIEIGRDITGFKVGDRIAAMPVEPCGVCEYCEWENPLLCRAPRSVSQGFGEYAVVPSAVAVPLPESLSFADGALIEPMACGNHAMNIAGLERGSRVLVLGGGAIALSAIFWARRRGAGRVVALSRSSHRNDIIMATGADAVLGFHPEDQVRAAETLGGPPDIVAECVGKTGMINLAIDLIRPRGTVLSMGMCMNPEPVLPVRCTYKEARLLFPLGYTLGEFVETARAFEADRFDPEKMVSDVIALEDLAVRLSAMRAGESGNLKVHVDPHRSSIYA
ncbi:MAG TPA: alcohol dehydrogenase catalytic domain-containing protein [Novosphingobium sp.]|nr:alcohol dehydrogenase catalytic domain-containing protein [Novosphingobium sp.]